MRLSAGREEMSDETQALCFLAGANSIFCGERLLTTPNPGTERDDIASLRPARRSSPQGRRERRSARLVRGGLPHLWLPYAQMKSAAPLAVARTQGSRITLADGRVLIDGIASWWTACHGYNHPHIRAAVARQLEIMPHVMLGGLGA